MSASIINKYWNNRMAQQNSRTVTPKTEREDFTNSPITLANEVRLANKYGFCSKHGRLQLNNVEHEMMSWRYYGTSNRINLNPFHQSQSMMNKYFKALINVFGSISFLLNTKSKSETCIATVTVRPTRDDEIQSGKYRDYQKLLSVQSELIKAGLLNFSIENSQSTEYHQYTKAHIHGHGTAILAGTRLDSLNRKVNGIANPSGFYTDSQFTDFLYQTKRKIPAVIKAKTASHVYHQLLSAWNSNTNAKGRLKNLWNVVDDFKHDNSISALMKWVSYCYKQYRYPIAYNKKHYPNHAKDIAIRWGKLTPQQNRRVLKAIDNSTYYKQLQRTQSANRIAKTIIINSLIKIIHYLQANQITVQQSLPLDVPTSTPQVAPVISHHYTSSEQWQRALHQSADKHALTRAIQTVRAILDEEYIISRTVNKKATTAAEASSDDTAIHILAESGDMLIHSGIPP